MIGWLLSELGGYIAAGGAIVAALFAAWVSGQRGAKKDAELDRLKRSEEVREEAKGIDDEVNKAGAGAARDELDGWMREGD